MEAVDAHDLSSREHRNGIWRPELKCAMLTSMVVVVEELGKDAREMALAVARSGGHGEIGTRRVGRSASQPQDSGRCQTNFWRVTLGER